MTPFRSVLCLVLLLAACASEERPSAAPVPTRTAAQALVAEQGQQLQGQQLQGQQMQDSELVPGTQQTEAVYAHRLTGMVLGGAALANARVEQGGLVAERPVPVMGTTASLAPCVQPGAGPHRACGWRSEGVGTCAPGTWVQLGAASACGLGACTGNAMLRVCTGTRPCEFGPSVDGAASQGMLDFGDDACDTTCPATTFRCPDSGRYNVLSASHDSTASSEVRAVASQGVFPLRETLRGAQLTGAVLTGDSGTGGTVRYRLAEVRPELAAYDTAGAGDTLLYTVEWQAGDGGWLPMCGPDADGLRAALPVAAVFDATGARQESTTHFTFGCTMGVIAKCYRWGYKPWLSHPGEPTLMRDLHWACTRMARADYCGNGISHTRDGTLINLWDEVPAPGPIQSRGEPVPGFLFEAGWSTSGAVCLSKARWLELPPEVVAACPDRLIPPGASVGPATVCDSSAEVLTFDPKVRLFNESKLNALP